MADQCSNCKYVRLRDFDNNHKALECRFTDPTPQGALAVWPQVKADDWCGEWEAEVATQKIEYPPDHPAPGDLGSVPL